MPDTRTPNRRKSDDKWWVFGFIVLAVLALISYVELQIRRAPPPVEYLGTIEGGILEACPGDALEYRVRVNVRQIPSIVNIVRTLWDREEARIIGQSEVLPPIVWSIPGADVDPALPYQLPDDIPPGRYSLEVGLFGLQGSASAYSVPFIVPEDCDTAR